MGTMFLAFNQGKSKLLCPLLKDLLSQTNDTKVKGEVKKVTTTF